MSEVYIHHHLGLGDHVCLNGMVWHIIEEGNFDKGYVFCKNKYFSNLKHLYTNSKVELIPIDENKPEVQLVDEIVRRSIGENDKFLRIGFCSIPHGKSCDVFFYNMMNIPYEKRYDNFRIERNEEEETRVFEKLNPTGEPYIFIHDDESRGFNIEVDTNYKIIRNDIEESVFHFGKIIENAKEFHCIESCIRCYSEYLNTDNVELFFHNSVRPYPISTRKHWNIK